MKMIRRQTNVELRLTLEQAELLAYNFPEHSELAEVRRDLDDQLKLIWRFGS